MAEIIPFRAWRYNEEKISPTADVYSPLLDALTPAQAEALKQNPYNAIHFAADEDAPSIARLLNEWKTAEILKQDILPAIYPYYQTFRLPNEPQALTRKGFMALLRVEPTQMILHERTLNHVVETRAEILSQSLMHFTPTHGLYQDPDFELTELLDRYMEAPLTVATDILGVENRLSTIQNPLHIRKIRNFIHHHAVYLADGHHRWETSRRVRERLGYPTAGYHLMYFTNLSGDDLRILPTHRVVSLSPDFSNDVFFNRAEVYFDIEAIDTKIAAPHIFQLILNGKRYKFSLKESILPEWAIELDLPVSVKRLDYTILHYFLLDRVLQIPYAEQTAHPSIRYIKDPARAASMGENGSMAVLVNEVSLKELLAVCEDGALMPQKSTFFYPKVLGGLVFASIDPDDYRSPFDKVRAYL